MKLLKVTLGLALTAALAVGGTWVARSYAADHLDPPARTNPMNDPPGTDRAGDIADIYAWHQGDGATRTLVTALTFNGPNTPTADESVSCDPDVLYNIHIDNTGDAMADVTIEARFGADDVGNCFVQISGLPGATAPRLIRTERVEDIGGNSVFVGVREDPFFFDLEGFRQTLSTGTLSFVNDRDFFAGKNDSAIVVEMPYAAAAAGADTPIKVWATTARIPGGA